MVAGLREANVFEYETINQFPAFAGLVPLAQPLLGHLAAVILVARIDCNDNLIDQILD